MPAPLTSPARAREELSANLMAVPAALALILAVVALLRRDSGVAGTPGAALAVFGALALTLTALAVGRMRAGRFRTFLVVMILIGGVLTLICAWFLMQGWLMLALALMLAVWLVFISVAR